MSRVLLVLAVLLPASIAEAGFLLSPSIRWGSFSAQAEDGEPTPNYFGYGGGLDVGYSFGQVFDIVGHYSFLPARLKSAKAGAQDASLTTYGGGLGLRIAESVYFGLRAGTTTYELHKALGTDELSGLWSGPSGGFSLGAVARVGKQSFIQTCFEVMHTVMQRDKAPLLEDGTEVPDPGRRRFDAFGLSLAYVFNGAHSYKIENTIFNDFLDTLIFF